MRRCLAAVITFIVTVIAFVVTALVWTRKRRRDAQKSATNGSTVASSFPGDSSALTENGLR